MRPTLKYYKRKEMSNSNDIQSGARGVLAAVALPGADAAVGAYQYAGQIPSPAGHWTRQLMAQKA